jgi:hypothetical protein
LILKQLGGRALPETNAAIWPRKSDATRDSIAMPLKQSGSFPNSTSFRRYRGAG